MNKTELILRIAEETGFSRKNLSLFIYLRLVQIRYIRHGPRIGFTLLIIIPNDKKIIVFQNLHDVSACSFILDRDLHPFIQQKICDIF